MNRESPTTRACSGATPENTEWVIGPEYKGVEQFP